MNGFFRSVLALSVNSNRYATIVATQIKFPPPILSPLPSTRGRSWEDETRNDLEMLVGMRYPNGPIGHWKKVTIWKEACIVHVVAVIHDYQGEGAIWSRKCYSWKDCPGALAQLSTDTVNFCSRSRPYQHEVSQPSGPGRVFLRFFKSASHPSFTGQSYNRIMSGNVLQRTVVPRLLQAKSR